MSREGFFQSQGKFVDRQWALLAESFCKHFNTWLERTPCQLEAIGNTGSEGHNHLQMSEQATTALSQKE